MTSFVVHTLVVGSMAANCYVVVDTKTNKAIIIDPGDDAEYISDKLMHHACIPILIVATHGHFDHILAARALQEAYKIQFAIHEHDVFLLADAQSSARRFLGVLADPPPLPDRIIQNGDTLFLGETQLTVAHIPGHTPGSIMLVSADKKYAFVGDTIFDNGAVGRTDFFYSDPLKLRLSIQVILSLPDDCLLYPGHGATTIVSSQRPFHPELSGI